MIRRVIEALRPWTPWRARVVRADAADRRLAAAQAEAEGTRARGAIVMREAYEQMERRLRERSS
jgi:hypothetical protein